MTRETFPYRDDPWRPVMIWHSPDWRPDGTENLPPLRHEHEELLAQCRSAVSRREQAYPALIERGAIDRDEARRDLLAWRLLADEWHWIVTGQGAAPGHHTLADRIAAVETALVRLEADLARRRDDALLYQRHLLMALAWHLGDGTAAPAIHAYARHHQSRPARPEPVEGPEPAEGPELKDSAEKRSPA
ncbi:hypothetical protein SAMN05518801_10767 [Novosphingobium sp. CF614]|uniref:hypothetical protein n=1 Tax=Novosphingobium sp. CF614 TaxID=1884364 RepID=UPI0008E0BB4E|nr:hypothetical protein [Novosphingobium sp. CF614]SFG08996.1 hypothetical protein SAMN05518801_10767 [Novosphingobium sp. CF614]